MKTVFNALNRCVRNGQACVLVSAVGGSGSVPRKTQAHMLVTRAGRLCGTVGGGAVEGKAIVLAGKLLECGESALETFVLRENDAQDLGMICGGKVTLHFKLVLPEDSVMAALAQRAVSLFEQGESTWLIIRLGTNEVSLYGQGLVAGSAVPKAVLNQLKQSAGAIEHDGEKYYAEQLISSSKVYIFGGGHVAQALVPVLASVDFRCVVLEDREAFADPALFPMAQEVRLVAPDAWGEGLCVTPQDCICIMTRGHQNDLDCQAFALRTPAYYIGVIGSRRKIAAANEKLHAMGFLDSDIARLYTPIGLAIGAQTPAEIAISIAAEMIRCRSEYKKA